MNEVSNKIDGAISSMNEAVIAIKDVTNKSDGAVTEMKSAVNEMNDSVRTMKNISLSIEALTKAIQNLINKKFN